MRNGTGREATVPDGGHRSAMSAPTANPDAASHNSVGNTRHHIAPPQAV